MSLLPIFVLIYILFIAFLTFLVFRYIQGAPLQGGCGEVALHPAKQLILHPPAPYRDIPSNVAQLPIPSVTCHPVPESDVTLPEGTLELANDAWGTSRPQPRQNKEFFCDICGGNCGYTETMKVMLKVFWDEHAEKVRVWRESEDRYRRETRSFRNDMG